MALVVNQDDTTMTTVRLDGKSPAVISTLSLGPVQPDAIGGVTFSLGEWIFVTHTAENRVATIDPIGAITPILEGFLTENPLDTRVKIGQRPMRIYRDPVDKEVLWTMNEGDPVTGVDTVANCSKGGSVSVLHNSHLGVGGEKPRVTSIVCLSGKGEHFLAIARPPAIEQELAFISSQFTGLVSILLPVPTASGSIAWSEFFQTIDLCDSTKEISLGHSACDADAITPNHSAPAGMFWSQITGKIYSHLSGYRMVVEIDPASLTITRRVDVTEFQQAEITPDGRYLFLIGTDLASDTTKVIGTLGLIDLTQPTLALAIAQVDHIRPAQFRFTPDGTRLYLILSNATIGLTPQQAATMKKDKLMVFDTTILPILFRLLAEVDLPVVGLLGMHGLDVWVTGPSGGGSAKGIVVTNAPHGTNGTVSLINAATNTVTATIPVGRNPKQVTVYYTGLVASDNQATPTW
jgi:YVTN family beta-propeller protein